MAKEISMIQTHELTENTGNKIPADKLVRLEKIMVATDFSPVSDRALEYTLSLARRYNSQIYLTHIVALEPYAMMTPEFAMTSVERLRLNAARKFDEILKSERLENVPCEVAIEEGPFWPTMESLIKKWGIDLIVTGTRGMGAVSKLVLGSTAEQIFRQARIPVLTVGPAVANEPLYEAEFKNILFATDFGLGGEREAAYAFSLAQEHRARLTFLHVIAPEKNLSEAALALKKQAVTHQMGELVPATTGYLCFPQFRTTVGDPVEEILRMAQESKADLIVMGAKPMKGLGDHAPNTKAYRVVCASPCPVLTIRS
jgi:nucleotide-binding universal stress UspA family protein